MNRRHIIGSLFGSFLSIAAAAAITTVTFWSSDAQAVEPWIGRPLTLPSLHASADFGVGLGQYRQGPITTGEKSSHQWGAGSSIEAAVGLPILGEIGVRTGPRFGDDGKIAGADAYGRLFDKLTYNQGYDTFANPEIFLRGTLVDVKVVAVGLETRFILPFADGTKLGWMPGVPVRVRIPNIARLDTGLYVPFQFGERGNDNTSYAFDVPAHLWFQSGDLFFGPMLGIRMQHIPGRDLPTGGSTDGENKTRFRFGVGAGYTVASFIDLKAQIYSAQLNDLPDGSNAFNTVGIGLGAGINIP